MDDKESESEPAEPGELIGMNSPWGVMWNIQKETGWTDEYLLWEIPWINVRMKLADAPHYLYSKIKEIKTEDELRDFLDQS
jgi:hypothetical protein